MPASSPAQEPEKIASVPKNVRYAIIIEVGHNAEPPRNILWLCCAFKAANRASQFREVAFPVVQINLRPFAFQNQQVWKSVLVNIAHPFDGYPFFMQPKLLRCVPEVHLSIVQVNA